MTRQDRLAAALSLIAEALGPEIRDVVDRALYEPWPDASRSASGRVLRLVSQPTGTDDERG